MDDRPVMAAVVGDLHSFVAVLHHNLHRIHLHLADMVVDRVEAHHKPAVVVG